MWTSKRVVLVALVLVVIAASTAVVAFAQTSDTSTTDQSQTPESQDTALLSKVAAIYQQKTGVALDTTALKESLAQARSEMRDEAVANRLQQLVTDGKITQEQADQYNSWWQAKPDTQLLGQFDGGFGGGMMGGRGGHGACR